MPSTNTKTFINHRQHTLPAKSKQNTAQAAQCPGRSHQPDIELSLRALALLRLLEFSELSGFFIPQGYCVDPVIPAQKYPGSDSPGVQVMSGSVFPHAWGMS